MTFVLRMAWREVRTSAVRLLFFFLCVALGVAAIVVIRSVMQTVRLTLTREARTFIGADVTVRSSAPLTAEARAVVDDVLRSPDALARAELVETQTMAGGLEGRGTGIVRLVEIMGVDPGFPFYGTFEMAGGATWSPALVEHQGVVVPPQLLVELGLEVGDVLRLGGRNFTIRAVVMRDRLQRGDGFAFGPRVYVSASDLKSTALLGFGSRATYQVAVKARDAAMPGLATALRTRLGRQAVVRDWRSLEDRLGQNIAVGENYLSLVGFAIVVLGGIGVWSVARVVVQQKVRSVAILKCLGTSSAQVFAIYLVQMFWLAAGGSLLGVVLAGVAARSIPASMLSSLGVESVGVTASAAWQGAFVGVLVSLLFAFVPLLDMQRVKPLLLLRADTDGPARRRDWRTVAAWCGTGATLVLVAIWQAGSVQAGGLVAAGLAGTTLVLLVAARLLVRLVAPLTRSSRFVVRHAAVSLGRPGNQTRVILMAVGLGCFFILTVRAAEMNLLREFDLQMSGGAPDLILIDIQADQVDGVTALVAPFVSEPPHVLPLMRGRVTAVAGRRLSLRDGEAVREHRQLAREYGLTYRIGLDPSERLLDGQLWNEPLPDGRLDAEADTEVSVERQVHEETGLGLGDIIRFDIAGQALSARVTAIRDVNWDEAQAGGFIFVLRPSAAVDRMARSFVGFLETRADGPARGTLQRDLVRAYPNVSAIDVRDVLASLREVIGNVTLAVTVVGAVTLAAGVLILVGAVAMTKFQRLYEAAIYRTLGASTRLIASMVAIEYAVLGLLAGGLGAAGALGLSWVLARYLFEIAWAPAPGMLAIGALVTAVLVAAVGVVSSLDVLVRKPLATLRSE